MGGRRARHVPLRTHTKLLLGAIFFIPLARGHHEPPHHGKSHSLNIPIALPTGCAEVRIGRVSRKRGHREGFFLPLTLPSLNIQRSPKGGGVPTGAGVRDATAEGAGTVPVVGAAETPRPGAAGAPVGIGVEGVSMAVGIAGVSVVVDIAGVSVAVGTTGVPAAVGIAGVPAAVGIAGVPAAVGIAGVSAAVGIAGVSVAVGVEGVSAAVDAEGVSVGIGVAGDTMAEGITGVSVEAVAGDSVGGAAVVCVGDITGSSVGGSGVGAAAGDSVVCSVGGSVESAVGNGGCVTKSPSTALEGWSVPVLANKNEANRESRSFVQLLQASDFSLHERYFNTRSSNLVRHVVFIFTVQYSTVQ